MNICFCEVSRSDLLYARYVNIFLLLIKGLKETTHGYKKNETKRMISHLNCNTMFLFFLTADSQILRNVHS